MFIFITGNDTEIGKTLVTSLIVKLLSKKNKTKKISIIKPVESGIESFAESDLGFIKKNNKHSKLIEYFNFYTFSDPISPYTASLIEKDKIKFNTLVKKIYEVKKNSDITIIEGAGGLMVPLTPSKKIIDLIQVLESDCYLVVSPSLGTINHTLLSIEALKSRRISFKGIVINQYPENPGISEIYNPVFFSDNKIKINGVIPKMKKDKIPILFSNADKYLSKELGGKFNIKTFIKSRNLLFKKSIL